MTRTYLVVGGGAAGTLLGIHLARALTQDAELILIEPAVELGRGLAYSTPYEGHLLNVPASGMSVFESVPADFSNWLARTGHPLDQGFVPRKWFGDYLGEVFERECAQKLGSRFKHIRELAIGVRRDSKWKLRLASGAEVEGDVLILATGNSRPNTPPGISGELISPFDLERLKKIPKTEPVSILGSGLTMVDVYLALRGFGHTGLVTAYSRKGFLPHAHGSSSVKVSGLEDVLRERTVLGLLKALRRSVDTHLEKGGVWQDVLTAFRPKVTEVWSSLPDREKKRFLRHLRPYWEVHRHRTPVAHRELLEKDLREKKLRIVAGRISSLPLSAQEILINATGQSDDIRSHREPLIESLITQGLVAPDSLGLGLDPRGTPDFYALGVLTRGLYWEITAIPELRRQAETLAQSLVR
jgi:uncharacterized NAD(P)/FAD-binding protein YdhS